MMIDPRLPRTARQVVRWLVNGDYERIASYTHGVRLSADLIERAVGQYGRKLTMPPEAMFEELDVIEVKGAAPRAWSVRCDLWTEEEGRSDLSLEMTFIDQEGEALAVELDNLHVL
jgi:hypothetical protein